MNSRFLHFLLALVLLLTGLNAAYAKVSYTASDRVVTREELIAAINAAPALARSSFLGGNAEAIAALALGVESGGHTSVYNGKCCYGLLQMTDSNIRAYSRPMYGREFGGETYRNLPLQEQINMWVQLTVDGENSSGFTRLNNMINSGQTSFDGNPSTSLSACRAYSLAAATAIACSVAAIATVGQMALAPAFALWRTAYAGRWDSKHTRAAAVAVAEVPTPSPPSSAAAMQMARACPAERLWLWPSRKAPASIWIRCAPSSIS